MKAHKLLSLQTGFFLVLASKLALVFFYTPASEVLPGYVNFVANFLTNPSLSPWQQWESFGESSQAFPYGYAQLLIFVPMFLLMKLIGVANLGVIAYLLTLLMVDLAIYLVLRNMHEGEQNKVFWIYWASPISFVAIYILGFNDAVAVLFLIISLWSISRGKYAFAGWAIIIAISAKASMALALPLFAILFFRNPNARKHISKFSFGASLATAVFLIPFALTNPSGVRAIFSNPEGLRVFASTLDLGVDVYLVPLGYLLIVLGLWKTRRVNFDLFQMGLGLVFLVIVLLTQAAPGWYFWLLPLLMAVNFKRATNVALTVLFSITYAWVFFPYETSGEFVFALTIGTLASTFGHTVLFGLGLLISISIWRESIKDNDYFRFSRKPFSLGIAGDSGVGKDTLASAISKIFGERNTAHLSGDDYHRWERGEPAWSTTTHLNPLANEINLFEQDALKLLRGQRVEVLNYDHKSGKKTELKTIKPNDFVVVSGLHALYSPMMRDHFDLKIFMEMEESLRTFLKLRRDVGLRGHDSESVLNTIKKRRLDSDKYVNPQRERADLIFRVEAQNEVDLVNLENPANFEWLLQVESRLGLDTSAITRELSKTSNGSIQVLDSDGEAISKLRLIGNLGSDLYAGAALKLAPGLTEFIDDEAEWSSGTTGLMQLIVLLQLDQLLAKRALA